jgi:hypothetical protein
MDGHTPLANGRGSGSSSVRPSPGNPETNKRFARTVPDPVLIDKIFLDSIELQDRVVHAFLECWLGRAVWLMRQHPRCFPAWLKTEFEAAFGYVCLIRRLYKTEISRLRCDCDVLALSNNESEGGDASSERIEQIGKRGSAW